ncbi:D-alanyl-D-alanine carboxypeptidase [Ruminococcaceae bacterium OttesenSCG-928-D13]|nr:D-alanyl-D-alanine carboxypeptidase [Ruminococcaceae bacterium OttesenSCG-928-D13]
MAKGFARVAGLVLAALLLCAFLLPVQVSAAEAPPEVSAEAYIVMDAATGQVLVAKNADAAKFPASITKIMTSALVLEYIDMATAAGEQATTSPAAVEALIHRATQISLAPGEACSVRDLLYATQIESANDAANVLAEHLSGSMDGFVQLMNEKARQLGLTGSHFVNPSGQPDEQHYVTAYDMAAITRWALTVEGFRELWGAGVYEAAPTNMRPAGRSFHTSNLIMVPQSGYYCEGATGSKSGYTDAAMYTLVTTAERGGTELICVSLANPYNGDKYTSTNALLDYCFGNFKRVTYPVAEMDEVQVPVYGGGAESIGEIDVYGSGEVEFLLHRSLGLGSVEVSYEVPESYVIGDEFAPAAALYLKDSPQQAGGLIATLPLQCRGLDQILAENTTAGMALARMAEEKPGRLWIGAVVILLLVAALIGRIAFVRHRREKRRRQRLAAAKAQLPVRIAPRPEPPQRRTVSRSTITTSRAGRPELRVVSRVETVDPRRVGRAR